MRNRNKKGHLAPKGWRNNRFNSINIKGDFAYCPSHNFVYDPREEERKLYNAEPCFYTDIRYSESFNNFYKSTYLYKRYEDISLKSCIRRTLKCHNIPVGTIVYFGKSWYYDGKKIDNGFNFKIKKENKLDIKYEINDPGFFKQFSDREFSQKLTDELRKNGFIVKVYSNNTNFISGLISSAALYTGNYVQPDVEEGEYAVAYGHGKMIGFSSKNNTFRGYSSGCDDILWYNFDEFDKWSRCNCIDKNTEIKDIIEILKNE